MRGAQRIITAVAAAICLLLAVAPGLASAHEDPFEPSHAHQPKVEGGTGSGPMIAIAVVVLMLGTAGALIALRRTARRAAEPASGSSPRPAGSSGAGPAARSTLAAAAVAAMLVGGAPDAVAAKIDRYSIANHCFAIQAAGAGYIANDVTTSASKASASRFFFEPTDLGTYLLYRSDRRFLDMDGDSVDLSRTPSRTAEWVIRRSGRTFEITNLGERQPLISIGSELRSGRGVDDVASAFRFVRVSGCSPYPEVEVNVSGRPWEGQTNFGEVRGTVEGHMHHMAFNFLGGRAHCGRPWHRYGAPYALVDCPDHQVADGNIAVLDNFLDEGVPVGSHSPDGWPNFDGWPTHGSLTHEQSYYRWVERAWRAGMRLYVNLMVENRVLCELYPLKQNSCKESESVRKQIRDVYAFQDYVDAQAGGPGKGFYRIVRNPFQARKVINQGKMAVVLGMEVSEPFDCFIRNNQPQCSKSDIVASLDELESKGLRQFELVNKFDNALTGVAGDNGVLGVLTNFGNFYSTGSFFRMDSCEDPENADNDPLAVNHNDDDLVGAVIQAYLPPGVAPVYPEGAKCNQNGLTALGAFAVRQLMQRKLLFDPDHMSALARSQALSIVEARRYSGVLSSHSWATDDSYRRIWKLGGMVIPSAGSSTGFANKYEHLMEEVRPKTKYYFGYGFGADQNGFATQGGPRTDSSLGRPVRYPFRSPLDPGVKVHRQVSGNRSFDVNEDGIAHYGLYPDWAEDLRIIEGNDIVRDMRRGAEAYLQTWERAIGIEGNGCDRSARNLGAGGVGKLRLGDRAKQVLRRVGQPDRRTLNWVWCAKGKGARKGKLSATFTAGGDAALIASNVRGVSGGGLVKGTSAKQVRKRAEAIGEGLFTRGKGGSTFVYRVERGRLRAIAVSSAAGDSLSALIRVSKLI